MVSKEKALTVALTGGGTGGHIYPAVAMGRGLQERMPLVSLHYLGTPEGLEAVLIPKEGWPFYSVEAAGLERKISLNSAMAIAKTGKGYFQARRHLRKIRPAVVVGTGGYVCGPVVLAAAHLGIPTLIHEQNAFPGLTNRWLSRVAKRVCVTFPQSARYFPPGVKTITTGLPIRTQILQTSREEGLKGLELNEGFRVLIVGGSQGARSLNQAMVEVYRTLKERSGLNWLHVTGQAGYNEYLEELQGAGIDLERYGNIKVMPYVYKIEEALSVADLVIGRAGASFLAEIMAKGLPSVLIPYPFAAENHQEFNANALGDDGGAIVIKEQDLSGTRLIQLIDQLVKDQDKLQAMTKATLKLGKPEALELLLEQVLDLAVSENR